MILFSVILNLILNSKEHADDDEDELE